MNFVTTMFVRVGIGLVALALALSARASGPPAPGTPLPHGAGAIAGAIEATDSSLRSAIDTWRASGAVPDDVTLYGLYQQRLLRLLAREPALARRTLRLLPAHLAAFAGDVVVAHRELVRITPPIPLSAVRVGRAAPPDKLLAYYREAQRRFRVPWNVLAAVNLVESAFGKLRSASAAGAQGPMQFMPATWRAYGLGGNVHDPHDAILGAANYLRAAGARADIRRALHAYNPSALYVDAVLRYARRIRIDIHAFYGFYSWQVFIRTPGGDRRVTGPGRG
jgi:membrane-bound lytic murein transglycosylase B